MATMNPSTWQIRKVLPETKRIIRVYAAEHNLTLAEALDKLAKLASK